MASFKCCKSKSFIHFVCINCFSVFHKYCLPRFKNQIRFVKDNQIICCKNLNDSNCSDVDSEKSILEKTISELAEDCDQKSKFIEKLKIDKNVFIQEAMRADEESSSLINKQQKIIDDLKEHIEFLNKNAEVIRNKQFEDKETQAGVCTRNASSSTNFEIQTPSGVSDIFQKGAPEPIVTESPSGNKSVSTWDKPPTRSEVKVQKQVIQGGENICNIVNQSSPINNPIHRKRQILLLTDDIDVTFQLRRCLDKNLYEIISVKKPGALLHQVIENMESLASNFNFQDHIIVVGGRNDIDKNKAPSFRNICDKLRLCAHTNVIFTSIPYYFKGSLKNKLIYKFNTKLYQFLNRFNACSEGQFSFVDINKGQQSRFKGYIAVSSIVHSIIDTNRLYKTLTFIQTSDVSVPAAVQESPFLMSAVITLDDSTHNINVMNPTPTNDTIDDSDTSSSSSSSFLYPRLSQVSLLL